VWGTVLGAASGAVLGDAIDGVGPGLGALIGAAVMAPVEAVASRRRGPGRPAPLANRILASALLMAVFGWAPLDFVYGFRNFVLEVWHRGFAALGRVGDYLLLGATVVIPVFVLIRLFSYRR